MCDPEQQSHQKQQQQLPHHQQPVSVLPEPLSNATTPANKQHTAPQDSPTGPTKLAHQFWFSYPPPGAGGGSSNSKTSQTDEEKQRDRQRCEREVKKEEQDALNYKRDRDAREARLLDFEIRRQQEREKKKEEQKIQHQQHQHQQQQQDQQQQQQQQEPSETSPPTTSEQAQQKLAQQQQDQQQQQQQQQPQHQQVIGISSSTPTPIIPTPPERGLPPAFRSHSIERENLYERRRQFSTADTLKLKKPQSTTPSPQAIPGPPPPPTPSLSAAAVVAGPPATAAAATAAIIPILPLGVATLRDDSTESEEQSMTCTHAHAESCHRIIANTRITTVEWSGMEFDINLNVRE